MKHLVRSTLYGGKVKRFNESSVTRTELQDFCEGALAYLLDEDFKVSCDPFTDGDIRWMITITKVDGWDSFFYPDYKDYFIPFIQLLMRRYTLGTFSNYYIKGENVKVLMWDNKKWVPYTIEQLINGDDSIFTMVRSFKIRVDEKL